MDTENFRDIVDALRGANSDRAKDVVVLADRCDSADTEIAGLRAGLATHRDDIRELRAQVETLIAVFSGRAR